MLHHTSCNSVTGELWLPWTGNFTSNNFSKKEPSVIALVLQVERVITTMFVYEPRFSNCKFWWMKKIIDILNPVHAIRTIDSRAVAQKNAYEIKKFLEDRIVAKFLNCGCFFNQQNLVLQCSKLSSGYSWVLYPFREPSIKHMYGLEIYFFGSKNCLIFVFLFCQILFWEYLAKNENFIVLSDKCQLLQKRFGLVLF